MRLKIVILVIFCIVEWNVFAQQQALFNSALINPYIENSALAGLNPYSQGFLHYRKQWLDIEGAPESSLFTIDGPLNNEKSGLGLAISSDKTNILGHIGIMTSYSHGIDINSEHNVRLGLGIKLNHNTIYFDKVKAEEEFEATLFNNFESATGFNSNFGALYNWRDLNIGFSGLNFLNSKIQYSNNTDNKELYFQYIPQVLVNVNYNFEINKDIAIRPEIAIRNLQGMPVQPEASVFAEYNKQYSAGIVYRNKNSLGFLLSALIYNRFTVGYSYQASLGKISGYSGSTHEIVFGYRFYTAHFQDQKPVDNEKIDQLLDFAQKQVDENKELEEKNKQLKQEQEQLRADLDKEKDEIAQLKELMLSQKESFSRAREEDETELDEIPDDLFKSPDEPIYIILGVFEDTYTAKQYQVVLSREAGVASEMLKRKNTQDYIVCVNKKFQSKKDLQREMTNLRKITKKYNSDDVWLYVTD